MIETKSGQGVHELCDDERKGFEIDFSLWLDATLQ